MNILVAEDSKYIREQFKDLVPKHCITLVENGKEALDLLTSEPPNTFDMIISDWFMPELEGIDLLRKLRDADAPAHFLVLPFLMMTSNSNLEDVLKVLQYEHTNYIIKPLDQRTLAKRIDDLMAITQKLTAKATKPVPITPEANKVEFLHEVFLSENNFLSNVFHSINDYIFVIDPKGTVLRVNQKVADVCDISLRNFVGKTIPDFLSIQTNEEREIRYKSKDYHHLTDTDGHIHGAANSMIPVSLTVSALKDKDLNEIGTIIYARDLAKENNLISQVIQLEKWKSIGQMASGIAHEVNNPLSIIRGFAENVVFLHSKDRLDDEKFTTFMKKIIDTSDRIARIIRSLRSLSRDETQGEMQTYSFKEIILDTLQLCKEKFRKNNIELSIDIQVGPETLICQSTQISQVMLNLLTNAYDAVYGLTSPKVKVEVLKTEKYFEFSVTDNGAGISKENRRSIFQPFFSTKAEAKGVGLGLSLSKAMVDQHEGELFLDVDSDSTRFVLQLPTSSSQKAVA